MLRHEIDVGTVLTGRFQIERKVRSGGMSTVLQGIDLQTHEQVAIKILRQEDVQHGNAASRLLAEALVLARLNHPGIVGYIDHGMTPNGQPFLVMQWLPGEDLAHRLRYRPLRLQETLALVTTIAQALAYVHQQGVIHRDVKPSNIMLCDGLPERAVLIDFGVARRDSSHARLTATGVVVGTLEYMAPEQADGGRELTFAADVYGLGVVLFECLSGQSPAVVDRATAIGSSGWSGPMQSLAVLRPELPGSLCALVARMLSAEPTARPQDAAQVLRELDSIVADCGDAAPPAISPVGFLHASGEHRLGCVLRVQFHSLRRHGATVETKEGKGITDQLRRGRLLRIADKQEVKLQWLDPQSCNIYLVGRNDATEVALRSVRTALAICASEQAVFVAIVTGKMEGNLPHAQTDVSQRAELLLAQVLEYGADLQIGAICLDAMTAGLVEKHYKVIRYADRLLLLGRKIQDRERPHQQQHFATPFVGRQRELQLLRAAQRDCLDGAEAQAIVMIAPSGMGKSRLLQELRAAEDVGSGAAVIQARAIPGSSGDRVLSQLLRELCGISDDDSRPTIEHKIESASIIAAQCNRGRSGPLGVPATELQSYLSEQVSSLLLHGGESLPAERIRDAVLLLLRAECQHRSVLVILEDLHWADNLTIGVLDSVLRDLAEEPLLLIALARPELYTAYPRLWAGRRVRNLRLNALSLEESRALLQLLLGTDVPSNVSQQMESLAGGNPLYLEELARSYTAGYGIHFPDTLVAAVQARLFRLPAVQRHILRVASILGMLFSTNALVVLLGEGSLSAFEIEQGLQQLEQEELITIARQGRLPGQEEYQFRHAITQEAAYATLSPAEQQAGHLAALTFLERDEHHKHSFLQLSQHAIKAGKIANAQQQLFSAAVQAAALAQFAVACNILDQLLALQPQGELLGRCFALQAVNVFACGDIEGSFHAGRKAMAALTAQGIAWFSSGVMVLACATQLQLPDFCLDLLRVLQLPSSVSALPPVTLIAMALGAVTSFQTGQFAVGNRCVQWLTQVAQSAPSTHLDGCLALACYPQVRLIQQDPYGAFLQARKMTAAFTQTKGWSLASYGETLAGTVLADLGCREEAHGCFERAARVAEYAQDLVQLNFAAIYQAHACCDFEEFDRADQLLVKLAAADAPALRYPMLGGLTHHSRGSVLYANGQYEEAEAEIGMALVVMRAVTSFLPMVFATLAWVLMKQGRHAAALQAIADGHRAIKRNGGIAQGKLPLLLAEAELCMQTHPTTAHATLRTAVEHLTAQASRIKDLEIRAKYLHHHPIHRRILLLASKLAVDVPQQ